MTAGGLAAVLTVAIGAVIMLGGWIGVRVQANNLDQEVGPYGPLILTFSEPVDQSTVPGSRFPQARCAWPIRMDGCEDCSIDPRHLSTRARSYQLTLASGHVGTNGDVLRQDISGLCVSVLPKSFIFPL